jgi:hypothetical protein
VTTQLVGYAGEFYLTYKLYREGLLATLTAQAKKDFDVLVQSTDGAVPSHASGESRRPRTVAGLLRPVWRKWYVQISSTRSWTWNRRLR